jgi:site-specific DNA-methyltransferase (adenine-specific)
MDKNTQEAMFSSKSTDWGTPQSFYDELNSKYNFTLDPCASDKNHKCSKYYTKKDDGLKQNWAGNTVFMNPPYGKEIKGWIQKAYQESRKPKTTVVCLLPARTDTTYWHDYCMRADEVHFIKGRLKFGDGKNGAPFPSAVVVFGPQRPPSMRQMDKTGKSL